MSRLDSLLKRYFSSVEPSSNFEQRFWHSVAERAHQPVGLAVFVSGAWAFALAAFLAVGIVTGVGLRMAQETRHEGQRVVSEQLSLHEFARMAPDSMAGVYGQISGISF